MSVQVKFIVDLAEGAEGGAGRYEDGEGREYRYLVHDNGTLAIYEKEEGGVLLKDTEPIVVFGPAAWFSVTGDLRTEKDHPGRQVYSF